MKYESTACHAKRAITFDIQRVQERYIFISASGDFPDKPENIELCGGENHILPAISDAVINNRWF
ncbi:hypothetical protein D3C86_2168400 [compost metagenome]